jgi:hypothetical protein
MNLFENTNKINEIGNSINHYAKTNGYGLLTKGQHWTLFKKDEMKVQIKFVEIKGKKKIEFITPLFDGVSQSLEIFIGPICREKFIRDIAKTDLIGKCCDKIELIRYIKINDMFNNNKTIEKNLKSILNKAKKLQEEISSLLDYLMFVKLN